MLPLVGSHNRNVDAAETVATYESVLGPLLTVMRVDGSHPRARRVMEDDDAVGSSTAIIWPRALLAPNKIDADAGCLDDVRGDGRDGGTSANRRRAAVLGHRRGAIA